MQPKSADYKFTPFSYFLLGALVIGGLVAISQYSFHLFHVLAELFSIVVGVGIFIVAWNTRHVSENSYIRFLGAAYLSIAILDLLHALSYKGLTVFPGLSSDPPIQFWIAARYLEAFSLLAAVRYLHRAGSMRNALILFGVVTTALAAAIFSGIFPACYRDGLGVTHFKSVSEFVISGILALAAWLTWQKGRELNPTVFRLLIWSIFCTILAELSFSFYTTLFGLFNQLGHYLKLTSFFLIYLATIKSSLVNPYEMMFSELAASEEKNRLILETTTQGFLEMAPDLTLRKVNKGLCILLRRDPAQLEGLGLVDLLDQESARDLGPEKIDQMLAGPLVFEGRFLAGGGTTVPGLVHSTPLLDEKGRAYAVVAFVTDLSTMKEMEALREDVERMARHDLRAPLNAIVQLPIFLLEDGNLDAEQTEMVEAIKDSGDRMLAIVNQSLRLISLERGSHQLELEPVELASFIRDVAAHLQPLARQRQVNVVFKTEGEAEPAMIAGEKVLLNSLFGNLLGNAMEACQHGQEVSLALSRAGRGFRLVMSNPGHIPQRVAENFFAKYFTSGKRRGTGLGTYLARLIARAHGGEASLDLTTAGTVRVVVELPAA